MQQKSCQKFIYKIPSKILKKSNWNFCLDLETAMQEHSDWIVSISDSQILRWIDELNGVEDADKSAREIKQQIKLEKRKPRSSATKAKIKELYSSLYDLQFQKDYLCVIMNSNSDYDRANKGFSVNGMKYHRLLGTNGGIKNSTIVYISERLYPEIKKRMDNGRNKEKEFVPAKLEAYQALICSGATEIPMPKGIIVVKDCITHFKDNVYLIQDVGGDEPQLTFEENYEITHNNSDGCGMMLPAYSKRVNEYLTGNGEKTISGMNTRYAWTKGMVYTFDFIEFAEKVAGTYEIIDVWGDKRDVRDAELILTESMLKLWDSYDSWEDFYRNCEENHYQFSTPKITPEKLENVRNTNYQFLQSYDFSDKELQELCQPTIDEINEVLGLDYMKSIVFLGGYGIDEENVFNKSFDFPTRALMADKRMIDDSFIRRKIWNMINNRIVMAKRGAIKVNANFAMISGDLYALAQSMFGLEVTGLLKAGEIYHKYWIDKGKSEVSCFRAPMTCANNIRRMKLSYSPEAAYWFRYIDTAILLNAWDTMCDALNGMDFDGDTNMDTDNDVIVRNSKNPPTIMCAQKKAAKKVPTEEDIIQANKLAFNDDIGTITNYVTSMIERQAGFVKSTEEYKTLAYRIMCGQHYQQCAIDRIKGVVSKPMPKSWYSLRECIDREGDSQEVSEKKKFNRRIVAACKPYFMIYVYPNLKKKYKTYVQNCDKQTQIEFQMNSLEELYDHEPKTEEMNEFIRFYQKLMPVGNNACVVNRISKLFEKHFSSYSLYKTGQPEFDYTILKSNVSYSKTVYAEITNIYKNYLLHMDELQARRRNERVDVDFGWVERQRFIEEFKRKCYEVCTNEDELCDIILDICYRSEGKKQFAWDIVGDVMLNNLLRKNNHTIHYPKHVDSGGDFTYCGEEFVVCEKYIGMENTDIEETDYFE